MVHPLWQVSEKTQIGRDTKKIDDTFGKSNPVVFIVPSDDPVDEKKLEKKLIILKV